MTDDLQIFDCEQGSDEWFKVRLGIPTASNFAAIMAKGEGVGRRKYLYRLAGEIITGEPAESYSNKYMERGRAMESELRADYEFITGAKLTRVGFGLRGGMGASPDSLVDDDGMMEIKTEMPELLLERLERKDAPFPGEHRAQCQGGMAVFDRSWCDLVIGFRGMKAVKHRIERSEGYISELRAAVARFNIELRLLVERHRG